MIKANELRVDNLVMTNTGSIVPIRGGGINAIEMGQYEVFPVPLTPEWLQRMGYVRFQYYTDEYLWSLVDENNTKTGDFCIVEENNRLIPMNGTGGYEYAIAREIQYVHQLQNLFFTLTGEELTIKEPT